MAADNVLTLLGPNAQSFFDAQQSDKQASAETAQTAKYWLVMVPGGDDPKLVKIDSLEKLLDRLAKLEGKDSQVYVFGGQRLHFTTSPNRLLVLDDNHAIRFADGVAVSRRDDDPEFTLQRDGFMGDPALYTFLPGEDESEDEEQVVEEDFE